MEEQERSNAALRQAFQKLGIRKDAKELHPTDSKKSQEFCKKLLGRELRTTLSDGRFVVGNFKCVDRLKNIILSEAVETRPPESADQESSVRNLGLVMVPGKHLIKVEVQNTVLEEVKTQAK
mmetsp:Transcript_15499/g.22809  ORF Transcript_15499/g.22809 Transcript_15499/m.22809 type:complete len:122 (-) Transcript_15499:113-478(-)|eukprot:CAMPEP_0113934246 /NCGR_PEP_ID=MMETSP1339-20121228/1595_1 /TAXON_ID=94617 /ORGANISM="Fibrocapsa japonica" /LENGTH=121 /DNA_ID=CAMNT_0000935965 /DNA_START=12 /DNA_END=377 /DNA_ORIENTATION=+ /assembly_acc=CAM_ASM_000762